MRGLEMFGMAHDSDILSVEAACAAFRIWDAFAQVWHDVFV